MVYCLICLLWQLGAVVCDYSKEVFGLVLRILPLPGEIHR